MADAGDVGSRDIPAIIVPQWMEAWNAVQWGRGLHQSEPFKKHFYMFTLPAGRLKELSGIYRRDATLGRPRSQDLGPQRYHDKKRSDEIAQYREYGFPWSDLTEAKRNSGDFEDLRKPGWLPTAILVNILVPGNERDGKRVAEANAIEVNDHDNGTATLRLPDLEREQPRTLHP